MDVQRLQNMWLTYNITTEVNIVLNNNNKNNNNLINDDYSHKHPEITLLRYQKTIEARKSNNSQKLT